MESNAGDRRPLLDAPGQSEGSLREQPRTRLDDTDAASGQPPLQGERQLDAAGSAADDNDAAWHRSQLRKTVQERRDGPHG